MNKEIIKLEKKLNQVETKYNKTLKSRYRDEMTLIKNQILRLKHLENEEIK